jgi:hypothetical protein
MLVSRESSLPAPYDLEQIPRLSVVVAYEDVECGKHAQATCDFLEERLGGEFVVENQMWKFDALAVPALREAAARDAALADLIFLSCRGTGELPIDVKAWTELWLGGQSSAFALVGLFDQANRGAAHVREIQHYLHSVATRAGMEFFAQPDVWPDNPEALARLAAGAVGGLPELDVAVQVAAVPTRNVNVGHWGLNE